MVSAGPIVLVRSGRELSRTSFAITGSAGEFRQNAHDIRVRLKYAETETRSDPTGFGGAGIGRELLATFFVRKHTRWSRPELG